MIFRAVVTWVGEISMWVFCRGPVQEVDSEGDGVPQADASGLERLRRQHPPSLSV